MRNYYQIKTVASAPPRRLIPIGKVFSATGLVIGNCRSLFRSVIECQHIWFAFFSFLALWLVLFWTDSFLLLQHQSSKRNCWGYANRS